MLPKGDRVAAPHTPRPRHGVPRRARPSRRWLRIGKFSSQGWARAPSGARRARASGKSAPSNMRLKLTGAYRSSGTGVLCPWRGTDCRPTALRRRVGRPQLKRDPLGGALPPHRHPSSILSGTVSTRGAERRCSRRGICAPRPTPHGRATGRPRRACPSVGWLPIVKFSSQGRARAPSGARRARASVKSAPSNMRLKLTGADRFKGSGVLCPGGHGLSSTTLAPAGGSPAA